MSEREFVASLVVVYTVFFFCGLWFVVLLMQYHFLEPKVILFLEAALDSSKFPEKLALQAKEVARKSLQSFPSLDSLTASSPLSFSDLEKKKSRSNVTYKVNHEVFTQCS